MDFNGAGQCDSVPLERWAVQPVKKSDFTGIFGDNTANFACCVLS